MKNCLRCGKPIPATGHEVYSAGPTCKCEKPLLPPDKKPVPKEGE